MSEGKRALLFENLFVADRAVGLKSGPTVKMLALRFVVDRQDSDGARASVSMDEFLIEPARALELADAIRRAVAQYSPETAAMAAQNPSGTSPQNLQ